MTCWHKEPFWFAKRWNWPLDEVGPVRNRSATLGEPDRRHRPDPEISNAEPLTDPRQPQSTQKDVRMKKEMLINVLQPEECRIAIVEDGVLEELYVERTSHESYTGNIYKGKVVNLEPAIQAAFVDFSVGRNGFLHVSDVEPQYYHRHQAADSAESGRRERDDRRRGRTQDRDAAPPAPGQARSEERHRERPERERPDRERPERSEKGRRDRSEPRRFGEGLTDEDLLFPPRAVESPPPPRTPEPPPRVETTEPRRVNAEAEEPRRGRSDVPSSFRSAEIPFGKSVERELFPTDIEEPRGRIGRQSELFDPDLPPSRTQRPRPQPPAPRVPEFNVEEPEPTRPGPASLGYEAEPEAPPAAREREPRRGRGRGRSSRPAPEPESVHPAFPEPILTGDEDVIEPLLEDRSEPPRRRGGGRAAIRARGGEGEPPRERPREAPPERLREGSVERPRGLVPEPEPERYRPFEPEPPRERERAREPERGRTIEPEAPRERTKPHDRAGEPGYIPRRERHRTPETAFGADLPPAFDWSELTEAAPDIDAEETDGTSGPSTTGKHEGPRRRRRRRGRRRERPVPGSGAHPSADSDEADIDDLDDLEVAPRAELAPRSPSELDIEPPDAMDEFDFDERTSLAEFDEDEVDEFPEPALVAPRVEEEIDPELEEEIRREIEEIAELEREMGLRGPVEARPRRGEDREETGRPGGRFTRGRGMVKPPIQEIFRRGDEVLVQVIKESIGTKGPTLSTYISIPGRYLVLMPGLNRVGVSRKIADEGQRRKLREIMNELNPPKGLGFIVRTAGLDRTKRELARDLAYLLRLWKVILRRIKKAKAPAPIYQESDMITRTIRDIFTSEIDTIWIDEPSAFERAQEFLRVVMPKFVNRLRLYEEKVPLFHKYGIEDEIAKIQRRHVPLPEGGSIVIDQTEALVAIDVNSGNFRVENDAERTAYEMNLRAAKEIARQLRLRDLGGVIVNDFIDMRDERHRRGVEKALRDAIKRDRARTKVLRMSQFGLIEMTRQRIRPSLKRSVYEDCTHCAGAGVVKTVESMSIDVMRLLALASHREEIRRINLTVSGPVATYLNNRKRREIARLESEANMTIHIRAEDHVPAEHLQIDCFDGNNSEIRLFPPAATNQRRAH